jgi:hypothetical protein
MKSLIELLTEKNIVKEGKVVRPQEKHGAKNAMGCSSHAGYQKYGNVYMFDFTLTYKNNEVKTYTADEVKSKHKYFIDESVLTDIKSISGRFVIDYGFYDEDDDRYWEDSVDDCEVIWKREYDGREFTEEWKSVKYFKGDKDYKILIIEAMDKTLSYIFSKRYRFNKIKDEKDFEKSL